MPSRLSVDDLLRQLRWPVSSNTFGIAAWGGPGSGPHAWVKWDGKKVEAYAALSEPVITEKSMAWEVDSATATTIAHEDSGISLDTFLAALPKGVTPSFVALPSTRPSWRR